MHIKVCSTICEAIALDSHSAGVIDFKAAWDINHCPGVIACLCVRRRRSISARRKPGWLLFFFFFFRFSTFIVATWHCVIHPMPSVEMLIYTRLGKTSTSAISFGCLGNGIGRFVVWEQSLALWLLLSFFAHLSLKYKMSVLGFLLLRQVTDKRLRCLFVMIKTLTHGGK